MKQLVPVFSRVILIRGGTEFTVQDILAFAWFLGELRCPWTELTKSLALTEYASESGLEPDNESLNSMSEEFRYARDLLTVEEIEQWLLARDLTEDDFTAYLVRRYWLDNPPETDSPEPSDYLTCSAELRELLRADLFLSGKLEELARAMSWRLAAAAELNNTPVNAESMNVERARFLERAALDESSLPEALAQLNRASAWLEECLQLEACYRRASDCLLNDQARVRILAAMRLPLTRFKIQSLTLRSREAAQEAVLCLTKDHIPPEQLAKECGVAWDEQELFLGDLPSEMQQQFLSAAAGEVLAPEVTEEAAIVTRVITKTDPVLLDEAVRDRVDEHLLEAHFSELSAKSIRWRLGGPAHE